MNSLRSGSNNLNVFKFDLPRGKGIYKIIQWPRNLFRKIKWAYQRVTKGYCDYDVYSLDVFYANLFVVSLRELAEKENGYPAIYDIKYKDLTSEEKLHIWKDKINSIADNFVIDEERYFISKAEYVDKFNRGFKKLNESFTDLWW